MALLTDIDALKTEVAAGIAAGLDAEFPEGDSETFGKMGTAIAAGMVENILNHIVAHLEIGVDPDGLITCTVVGETAEQMNPGEGLIR